MAASNCWTDDALACGLCTRIHVNKQCDKRACNVRCMSVPMSGCLRPGGVVQVRAAYDAE